MGIQVLPVTHEDLLLSEVIRTQYGILTNDSLIIGTMQRNRIQDLITYDRGFENVDAISMINPDKFFKNNR